MQHSRPLLAALALALACTQPPALAAESAPVTAPARWYAVGVVIGAAGEVKAHQPT